MRSSSFIEGAYDAETPRERNVWNTFTGNLPLLYRNARDEDRLFAGGPGAEDANRSLLNELLEGVLFAQKHRASVRARLRESRRSSALL